MKFRIVAALAFSASALALMPGELAAQRTRAISQSSAASAAQQHPQIVAEFGGEESGTRSTYVRTVGARVAAHSNISGGGNAFRFTTLNSPVMNAFAVPGGYLYITRQLLALMNDEAELALVLGHEAGHIAARHSSERQRTNILSQLGALVLGAVTGSGQLAQIAAQGAQLYALRYSRSQEYESDDLGIRYMTAAGS
jgi:predicted Zn-dependent protease